MSDFFKKFKYVKLRDVGHLFLFLVALPIALIKRITRKDLWLICDNGNEADDNGFVFFEYLSKQHPKQDAVFAVGKNSPDRDRVEAVGKTVAYGSFRHWILYLTARVNISSQKSGKPNYAVCHLLEVYGLLKNNRVFLQHGIILTDISFLHYKNTRMSMFLTSVRREYEFVKENYGYPDNSVVLTGQPRLDRLHNAKEVRGRILIMPTWRKWIGEDSFSNDTRDENFLKTEYFKRWNSLTNSKKLAEICEKYDLEVFFYLHREAGRFLKHFSAYNNRIRLCRYSDHTPAELLITSQFLITDYSSVQTDFAYMKKPMAYYHFDYERYTKEHYQKGYFSYEKDGFGPVFSSEKDLLKALENSAKEGLKNHPDYLSRVERFFIPYDNKNCERTYNSIKERWK